MDHLPAAATVLRDKVPGPVEPPVGVDTCSTAVAQSFWLEWQQQCARQAKQTKAPEKNLVTAHRTARYAQKRVQAAQAIEP